jgi:hypothetical protein
MRRSAPMQDAHEGAQAHSSPWPLRPITLVTLLQPEADAVLHQLPFANH